MNKITSSATLFLATVMLAVGSAVAFPTVKNVVDFPEAEMQNVTSGVESADVSEITDADHAIRDDNLLVALADEKSVPPIPVVAVPAGKSEKSQSQYWIMKCVLGDRDVGVDRLPSIGVGSVMLIHKGEVVGSYLIGPGGIAQVPQLSSGAYSIVVRSIDGFCVIGTYLVAGSERGELTVKLALVPIQESPVIDTLLARALKNHSGDAGRRKEFRFDDDMVFVSSQGIVGRGADGVARIRLLEFLDEFGLAQTIEGLSVHFVLGERIVSHGITDEDGIAELQGVENGRYAMIVTGQRRVLVISVLVEDQLGEAKDLEDAVTLITNLIIGSVPAGLNQPVNVAAGGTIPAEDIIPVYESMGIGPGGGAGGGTGGGGGGGGTGGGGGLLGAALAGTLGYLIGDNNNDSNGVVSPAL